MKRYEPRGARTADWFTFDVADFEGGWKPGQVKVRTRKAVRRDEAGQLILEHWVHGDKFDTWDFHTTCYVISYDEFAGFLETAIAQGQVAARERTFWIRTAQSKSASPDATEVVFRNDRFELGRRQAV